LSAGASTILVTAVGSQLEIEAVADGCAPPPSLLFFDPATGKADLVLAMGSGDADMSFQPYPTTTGTAS
ncbi:MAG TPA: hypothetical protein VGP46_09970, partial [Acidimicrobiales bacterium]|nr:hypothetical protein [Acidimicrobiales bacterium]